MPARAYMRVTRDGITFWKDLAGNEFGGSLPGGQMFSGRVSQVPKSFIKHRGVWTWPGFMLRSQLNVNGQLVQSLEYSPLMIPAYVKFSGNWIQIVGHHRNDIFG